MLMSCLLDILIMIHVRDTFDKNQDL